MKPKQNIVTEEEINELKEDHFEERFENYRCQADDIALKKSKRKKLLHLKEQRQAIAAQIEKIKYPTLWQRMTGKAREDRLELGNLRLKYENSRKEMNEYISRIELEHQEESGRLVERQSREMHAFKEQGWSGLRIERASVRQRDNPNEKMEPARSLNAQRDFER